MAILRRSTSFRVLGDDECDGSGLSISLAPSGLFRVWSGRRCVEFFAVVPSPPHSLDGRECLLDPFLNFASPLSNPPAGTLSDNPWNVPNAITSLRFVLAIGVMAAIPLGYFWWALVLFSIAAATDWMDGYWARKYGQVTKLGRIFDPFVDKIIICGSFIALVEMADSPVASWMATVVVARELLVTSLRGIIEGGGGDFSANQLGKWKMVFQCAAVIAVLLTRVAPGQAWIPPTAVALLWIAIVLTVISGWVYVVAATKAMSEPVR